MPVLLSVWVIPVGAAGDGKLLSMPQWALPRHKGLLQLEQLLRKSPWREEPLGMSPVQLNHPDSTGAVERTSSTSSSFFSAVFYSLLVASFSPSPALFPLSGCHGNIHYSS